MNVQWWMVTASAVLQAVATSNYACFGRAGVPRYPGDVPPAAPDPAELCVELYARDWGGETRLALLDLTLRSQQQNARQFIWSAYDAARHMQVIWVWDFYRIQSIVALRVAQPSADDASTDVAVGEGWQGALDAIRALKPGDTLTFDARSACGEIRQTHTLSAPAVAWSPPGQGEPNS